MPKKNNPSFLQAIREVFKEIPKGVWIFFIGAGLGAGILGIIWTVSSADTDVPHAQIKEDGLTYEVVYNGKTKTPTWVVQTLDGDIRKIDESRYSFQQDPEIPPNIQPHITDYEGSGFVIGTLIIPTNLDSLEKIFYLTNTAPFVPELKSGYWKKLNAYIATLAKDRKIMVVSGPLYLSEEIVKGKKYIKYQVIGKNKVAVPSHFFRVIYSFVEPSTGPEIYVIPNKNVDMEVPLQSFQLKTEEFETISGLLLPENIGTYFFPPVAP